MMTLRQVEVMRAVMGTGTIGGAARLLNVSAPGISRLVKYTEKSLGIRFFQRQNGRYFPTPEAQNIFEQINGVYKKVDDLTEIISKIGHGALSELRVGSVPSISKSWCLARSSACGGATLTYVWTSTSSRSRRLSIICYSAEVIALP